MLLHNLAFKSLASFATGSLFSLSVPTLTTRRAHIGLGGNFESRETTDSSCLALWFARARDRARTRTHDGDGDQDEEHHHAQGQRADRLAVFRLCRQQVNSFLGSHDEQLSLLFRERFRCTAGQSAEGRGRHSKRSGHAPRGQTRPYAHAFSFANKAKLDALCRSSRLSLAPPNIKKQKTCATASCTSAASTRRSRSSRASTTACP